jgi:hypothetical protein
MDTEAIIIYAVCDEVIKLLNIVDDPQTVMSNAEIMAFSIISAKLVGGNHKLSRWLCIRLRYFSSILSESRVNRRIHRLPWLSWMAVFRFLSFVFTSRNDTLEFAVDSFPVACCAKNRIDKRKIFIGKEYIGFSATKKRHFCGLKVHMVVTRKGEPVEINVRPGSENDVSVLWRMDLDLPSNAVLYADGAYTSYDLEDILKEEEQIQLLVKRRASSKRAHSPEIEKQISSRRQIIETAFSCITGLLPRHIRARTENGFMIRLMSAVLAYSLSLLL